MMEQKKTENQRKIETERSTSIMHIKFVARCNRSSQKREETASGKFGFYFIMQSTVAYETPARTQDSPSRRNIPFYFGVQTKANRDKSIINARLHTKAAQCATERDSEREKTVCSLFKVIASFKGTSLFACIECN